MFISRGFAESLLKAVNANYFHPEVYVYPPPRAFSQGENFELKGELFDEETQIYLHIPFCSQICDYCGYVKMVDNSESGEMIERYCGSLVKEIELYSDILSEKKVKTLHFGGGTPNILSTSQLETILSALHKANNSIFDHLEEFSIESTPNLISEEKVNDLLSLGFDRISIGIQSLDDEEILFCSRSNTTEVSKSALGILQSSGVKNVVADLMIGIEGQTVESFGVSCEELLQFEPDTVELYALGVSPTTKTQKAFMSSEDIYNCYRLSYDVFENHGYSRDAHNRFSTPDGSFLQEDYVFEDVNLIGFGAGTRTYLKDFFYRNFFDGRNHRKTIMNYMRSLEEGVLPIQDVVVLDDLEKMHQFSVYNIECMDLGDFEKRFGLQFHEAYPGVYGDLVTLGFIKENETSFILNEKGSVFRDLICSFLFSEKVKVAEREYRPYS